MCSLLSLYASDGRGDRSDHGICDVIRCFSNKMRCYFTKCHTLLPCTISKLRWGCVSTLYHFRFIVSFSVGHADSMSYHRSFSWFGLSILLSFHLLYSVWRRQHPFSSRLMKCGHIFDSPNGQFSEWKFQKSNYSLETAVSYAATVTHKTFNEHSFIRPNRILFYMLFEFSPMRDIFYNYISFN